MWPAIGVVVVATGLTMVKLSRNADSKLQKATDTLQMLEKKNGEDHVHSLMEKKSTHDAKTIEHRNQDIRNHIKSFSPGTLLFNNVELPSKIGTLPPTPVPMPGSNGGGVRLDGPGGPGGSSDSFAALMVPAVDDDGNVVFSFLKNRGTAFVPSVNTTKSIKHNICTAFVDGQVWQLIDVDEAGIPTDQAIKNIAPPLASASSEPGSSTTLRPIIFQRRVILRAANNGLFIKMPDLKAISGSDKPLLATLTNDRNLAWIAIMTSLGPEDLTLSDDVVHRIFTLTAKGLPVFTQKAITPWILLIVDRFRNCK